MYIVKSGLPVEAQRDPKNNAKKEIGRLRNQNMTCHMFAETTHGVAATGAFACMIIPTT